MSISLAVIWSVRLPGIAFEQNTYGFSIHSQLDRERRAGILGNFLQAGASALEVFLCRQKCCCTIYLPTDNLGLGCLRTRSGGTGPTHTAITARSAYMPTLLQYPSHYFRYLLRALPRGHYASPGPAFSVSLSRLEACLHTWRWRLPLYHFEV